MATMNFEDMIADGRVRIRPYSTYTEPVVLTVSLDLLCTRLRTILHDVYLTHEPLKLHYSGTHNAINAAVTADVNALVDFALQCCYNRLRSVCERYSPATRVARCNNRAPVSARMEFPTWLSSLLSSIGPLRITDGPVDKLVIYVPPPNTMNNYGRAAAQAPAEGHYARLISNLRAVGIATTPIDMNVAEGSFWTTCAIETNADGLFSVVGTVHPSHYTNDDALRACVLAPQVNLTPFAPVTFTVGYVDDVATLTALAAVAAPPNIPAGEEAGSAGRPVGLQYNVNYFGIQPAVGAIGTIPPRNRGMYVIGRGTEPILTCYLAEHITNFEVLSCLRTVLTRTGPAPARN